MKSHNVNMSRSHDILCARQTIYIIFFEIVMMLCSDGLFKVEYIQHNTYTYKVFMSLAHGVIVFEGYVQIRMHTNIITT